VNSQQAMAGRYLVAALSEPALGLVGVALEEPLLRTRPQKFLRWRWVAVLRRQGISAAGHETIFKFRGALQSRNERGDPKKL
jgi:hypothetical protein